MNELIRKIWTENLQGKFLLIFGLIAFFTFMIAIPISLLLFDINKNVCEFSQMVTTLHLISIQFFIVSLLFGLRYLVKKKYKI